jgi:hypothetical protein
MKLENSYQQVKVSTSREVIVQAKTIAKNNRQTFSGWLADLIEKEVRAKAQERKAQ